MRTSKYLNKEGVEQLWNATKNLVATKSNVKGSENNGYIVLDNNELQVYDIDEDVTEIPEEEINNICK